MALPLLRAPCQGYRATVLTALLERPPAAQESGHLVFLLRDLKWFPIIVKLKFLPISRIFRAL